MDKKPVLIFDHDGTLHDSMYVFEPAVRAGEQWLRDKGYDVKPVEAKVISSCLGLNSFDMWEIFGYKADPQLREELMEVIGKEVGRLLDTGIARWFDGTEEMLDVLKVQGYHMVILSNCEKNLANYYWNHFNMEKWFDKFYDCESYGFAPKTEIVKVILNDYSGSGIMVGDRFNDLECARSADIPFIGCAYGFSKEGELDDADRIAGQPSDIPKKIKELAET